VGRWSERLFFIVAAALLLLALALDLGFTRPGHDLVQALAVEQARVSTEIGRTSARDIEHRELAERLGVDELGDLVTTTPPEDPLSYLGATLDRSRLTRLELTTMGTSSSGRLQRTRFTLRVLGSYGQILDFVRDLEEGPRLVTVDALTIETMLEQTALEGRLTLSIHDPRTRSAS